MTVIYPRFHQTSAGGFDDLDGLLYVQRRLTFKSGQNETLVFAAVVEPKFLAYSSDGTYLQTVAWCSHGVACFCCCRRNCDATRRGTRPCNLPTNDTALVTLR